MVVRQYVSPGLCQGLFCFNRNEETKQTELRYNNIKRFFVALVEMI